MCMGGGCHPEEYYMFIIEETEFRKYPRSIIGLVRENSNDTIEIFYSNATEQEGVNEVLTAKFTTDTIVGMNEVWIKVDFGKQFGKQENLLSADYTEGGGQYLKICNRGKGDLFYFVLSNPNICNDNYRFRDDCMVYDIVNSDDKSLSDILFQSGEYNIPDLNKVASYFKNYAQGKGNLYSIPQGKSIYDEVHSDGTLYKNDIPYSLLDMQFHEGSEKGLSFGFIFSQECVYSNANQLLNTDWGGCYKQGGCGN